MQLEKFAFIKPSDKKSFASFTFKNRLPKILNDVLEHHQLDSSQFERVNHFRNELLSRHITEEIDLISEEKPLWVEFNEGFIGVDLIDLPFFFCEIYFYRYLLYLIEYPILKIDPFKFMKQQELQQNLLFFKDVLQIVESEDMNISKAIKLSLEGNKADLSQLNYKGRNDSSEIIINDIEHLVKAMGEHREIHLIADNAATELFSDLVLLDTILTNYNAHVFVHLKAMPLLVSDAIAEDFDNLMNFLIQNGLDEWVKKIKSYITSGRVILKTDFAWNAPIHFRKLFGIKNDLIPYKDDCLVISKGDANYRRFFEDRKVPENVPAAGFNLGIGTTCFALRTLKSELIVGVDSTTSTRLNKLDPNWRVNGNYSVIQKIV